MDAESSKPITSKRNFDYVIERKVITLLIVLVATSPLLLKRIKNRFSIYDKI